MIVANRCKGHAKWVIASMPARRYDGQPSNPDRGNIRIDEIYQLIAAFLFPA